MGKGLGSHEAVFKLPQTCGTNFVVILSDPNGAQVLSSANLCSLQQQADGSPNSLLELPLQSSIVFASLQVAT
jgi:hypothetical protein